VADVEVNRVTGDVHVSRVVVGHDAGTMINPAGVRHQVHGNVLQTTSRALKERVEVEPATNLPVAREWGSYPILSFREVPVVEVMLMPRPGEPPLGAGESSSVPGTAAIANAIFDATGVRFREPPFTPEVVRAGLGVLPDGAARGPSPQPSAQRGEGAPHSLSLWERVGVRAARTAALAIGAFAAFAGLLGWRSAIAPVATSSAAIYTAETIDRGRQLAAAGDCVVCHTAPGGVPNAGGRALETPFGTVYSTNLTPDPVNGIGTWSFSAFQRAMREGISRDGRHLYPAFPYTAFTQTSDDDLSALYAYLMAQPAVASTPPTTQLAFPFSLRPLMALWNALYLTPGTQAADPTRSAQWNRGAYLVNGLGHCGACHTPRGALGAELGGASTFAGAVIEGWHAPALTALAQHPVPWTETELFRYLRFGHSAQHGSASGPMAPVVRELAQLPEADVRAMAHYLASFNPPADEARNAEQAKALIGAAERRGGDQLDAAQRLFNGACGACHHAGNGPEVFGQNLPLALSSKLHGAQPDNLLRVILEGVREPASSELGFMPAFRDALDDAQVARLAAYLRTRFAPGQPAWRDLEAASARLRAHPSSP
jgi:nicotinate dehydrogenase subunit B